MREYIVYLKESLQSAKSLLGYTDPRAFTAARNRANPYEMLKREFFQNRAALKV